MQKMGLLGRNSGNIATARKFDGENFGASLGRDGANFGAMAFSPWQWGEKKMREDEIFC